MINDYLFTPSRQTTDKALAEAAGKPVLELQQDSAAYASYSQKVTPRNALHAQRAGAHTMLHLACSQILATLQEDHADWQTAAFPALPRQGWDHRWPPDRACKDVLIPCHQNLLSGVQLEDHVRDVRGEINKEMKKAVRLAYVGRVAPKDSEVTSVPSRTGQDRKMAESLLTGRSLPRGI